MLASDIQKLNPGDLVELFKLDISMLTNNPADVLYWHAGTNKLKNSVVWQGNTYVPVPVNATGFEISGQGKLPRPQLQIANLDGSISTLCRQYEDLIGARLTRYQTFAKYLDIENWLIDSGTAQSASSNTLQLAASAPAVAGALTGDYLTRTDTGEGHFVTQYDADRTAHIGTPTTLKIAKQNYQLRSGIEWAWSASGSPVITQNTDSYADASGITHYLHNVQDNSASVLEYESLSDAPASYQTLPFIFGCVVKNRASVTGYASYRIQFTGGLGTSFAGFAIDNVNGVVSSNYKGGTAADTFIDATGSIPNFMGNPNWTFYYAIAHTTDATKTGAATYMFPAYSTTPVQAGSGVVGVENDVDFGLTYLSQYFNTVADAQAFIAAGGIQSQYVETINVANIIYEVDQLGATWKENLYTNNLTLYAFSGSSSGASAYGSVTNNYDSDWTLFQKTTTGGGTGANRCSMASQHSKAVTLGSAWAGAKIILKKKTTPQTWLANGQFILEGSGTNVSNQWSLNLHSLALFDSGTTGAYKTYIVDNWHGDTTQFALILLCQANGTNTTARTELVVGDYTLSLATQDVLADCETRHWQLVAGHATADDALQALLTGYVTTGASAVAMPDATTTYRVTPDDRELTPDPDEHFVEEIFYVNQRSSETPQFITLTLSTSFDAEGIQLPRGQYTRLCPARVVYRGADCGYNGAPVADINDNPTTDPTLDACGKRLTSCKLRFGAGNPLPFGGFPGVGLIRQNT